MASAAPQTAGIASVSALTLQGRRIAASVVGRQVELGAIRQELAAAKAGRLAAITLEGEPGIGKTRLLLAAAELAAAEGFVPLAVVADEEIRGPFLLARSILATAAASGATAANGAREPLQRALDAISGHDDPSLDGLSPRPEAAARLRSRRARDPRRRGGEPGRHPRRRRPVGRRGQPAPAALRRPRRRRPAGLHRPGGASGGARARQRSRDAPCGHGSDGHGAAAQGRALHAGRDDRVPEAGARGRRERGQRRNRPRAGRRRRLHRRGAGADVHGDGPHPGARRRLEPHAQRRAAAPLRSAHAHPAAGSPAAR